MTNIQFAELLALIRSHIRRKGAQSGWRASDVQFMSRIEFEDAVRNVAEAFHTGSFLSDNQKVFHLYFPIFRHIVVMESFFGSCTVYLPPDLEMDVFEICAKSGYIHSCGYDIYSARTDKADVDSLLNSIGRHLKRMPIADKPVFFAVYAHEDFRENDRELMGDLSNGLDSVKISLEKIYLSGNVRLVSFLRKLDEVFPGKFIIPDPGSYRKMHIMLKQHLAIDRSRTLWLIMDRAIGSHPRQSGDDRFLICYEQRFKNANPLHIFDENKPAWISPTTIPHALLGAMINLTRPWWPRDKKTVLLDPFAGTGTTLLESLKDRKLVAKCSDNDPLARIAARDNLRFFGISEKDLAELLREMTALYDTLSSVQGGKESSFPTSRLANSGYQQQFDRTMRWLRQVKFDWNNVCVTAGSMTVRRLRATTLYARLLFYVGLRAMLRHMPAFERRSLKWREAYLAELSALIKLIQRYQELRGQEIASHQFIENRGPFCLWNGNYSLHSSIRPDTFHAKHISVELKDAMMSRASESCDVIVTDPPYGFNRGHQAIQLAKLYQRMIRIFVSSLAKEGQLVVCLLDRSHTGRHAPYFVQKNLITHQLLVEAEKGGREVVKISQAVPSPTWLYQPPYYWESERTLRRAILHFRLRNI